MILRFFAMWERSEQYTKPMVEFLNGFNQAHRYADDRWLEELSDVFKVTVGAFAEAMPRPFRLGEGRVVNVAVFDSMAFGLAKRISEHGAPKTSEVAAIHNELIWSKEYVQVATGGTSDESSVRERLRIATEAFKDA